MANTSAPTTSAIASDRDQPPGQRAFTAASHAPAYVDFGQPIDNPLPISELIGFDEAPPTEPTRGGGRGSDLSPAEPLRLHLRRQRSDIASGAVASSAPAVPAIPVLIEPTFEPVGADRSPTRRTASLLSRLQKLPRPMAPTIKLPALLSPSFRVIASCAALVVAVGVAGTLLVRHGLWTQSRPAVRAPATPPSNPSDRLAFYRKGADAGDAEAQLQLGILYARGDGVAQDYAVAAKWFQAAADQGLPRAEYDVGVLYERGRGVAVDLVEATKWYRKAADAKYPLAQYNLAVCYTKGQGIRKDLSEAALWYRRAGLQGMVQAMVNLGTMYERGEGVPNSPVDAYAWYLVAGRRGNDTGAKRAADLFGAMPKLDQIRAEALASDVAASIHDAKLDRPGPAAAPAQLQGERDGAG